MWSSRANNTLQGKEASVGQLEIQAPLIPSPKQWKYKQTFQLQPCHNWGECLYIINSKAVIQIAIAKNSETGALS